MNVALPVLAADRETWPLRNYTEVYIERMERLKLLRSLPIKGIEEYYSTRPHEFIEHFCDTVDPRNAGTERPTRMPFIMFRRQHDLVTFLYQCYVLNNAGLIEKCRDYGATWVCCAFSVWIWRFHPGSAVGWGSRIEDLVDKLGDMSSIFEKMRAIIDGLPVELLPKGFRPKDHMTYMKIINPENGATIVGETGDNIGRGGRTRIYFKDESAHYQRPEKIEAALGDNTNVQIDISSVNGLGNVFHRKREAGAIWNPMLPMDTGKTAVFIADWRDHPGKSQKWYDDRRRKAEDEGLLHIFEQEVNRNYAAAIAGVIIKADWVRAAYDAHLTLGFDDDGPAFAALDPMDEGGDKHGYSRRKGVVLRDAQEWGEGDPGVAARRVMKLLRGYRPITVMYDSIGIGAGVKSEINRQTEEGTLDIAFVPWIASGKVLRPKERVIPKDKESPRNKDAFQNMKAQGWYALAQRFYKTFRAIQMHNAEEDWREVYEYDELISISTEIPLPMRLQLEKELSQAVAKQGAPKFTVDKKPPGTRSPNIADSVVMNYFPVSNNNYHLDAWG
ncbi:putative terminase large subunit [Sinorhizobium phage HMSP1-Susan]|nr:putative terminase large subunit [Sinorhizobium phage HMSP1-Susan]